ncbi:unnamed protein product, partial [Rangifer tarandus platyrhynchus]
STGAPFPRGTMEQLEMLASFNPGSDESFHGPIRAGPVALLTYSHLSAQLLTDRTCPCAHNQRELSVRKGLYD